MDTNKDKMGQQDVDKQETPEIADDLGEVTEENISESDAAQTLADELKAAQAALEKEKKEYLFLMAEFDNYRKRVIKEKADIIKNGAEKVLAGLLPIVDDFERGLKATKDAEDPDAVRQGMELIYNKLVKYLEANGVKAMDSTGQAFDPEFHEAIATIPAPSEDLKGKVIDTTQTGYTINDKVLRHAKVAVGE